MIEAVWQKATILIVHLRSSNIVDFVEALLSGECIELRGFESDVQRGVNAGAHGFFEGCLPVEILARRDPDALTYGPMRPVGLTHHLTSAGRPYAIVQLRQDNVAGSLYQPGWLSDQSKAVRTVTSISDDPRIGTCRVCAFRSNASQHIHFLSGALIANAPIQDSGEIFSLLAK